MRSSAPIIALVLCFALLEASFAAESQVGYSVIYSGRSLPTIKGGEELSLRIASDHIRLSKKHEDVITIPANAITDLSYGEEVHHRIGTAAGLAVVSLGIGALVAFSKSKKHYIGLTWADGDRKGGIVLQADKNEYRGLLAALEGVSGKKAVDTDTPKAVVQDQPLPQTPPQEPSAQNTPKLADQPAAATQVSLERQATTAPAPQPITVRFVSTPPNAEVEIDGEYWGGTPTADLTRLSAGSHVVVVKKIGYLRWERRITLAPGDDRTVNAELEVDSTKPHISGL
jgi:hypothetical protein